MAPSMSPVFTARALDVRMPNHPEGHDPFLQLRAEAEPSAAATSSSGGVSGTVAGLIVLLVIIGLGAIAAAWLIIRQRKQLLSVGTIRVMYNVDNLSKDAEANKTDSVVVVKEKSAKLDTPSAGEEKLYTIDLSDDKPRDISIPVVPTGPVHIQPSQSLRRKQMRNVARQRLRIIIPSGVSIPDVELVTTATVAGRTPNTGVSSAFSSAISTSRVTATLSRRNTARTPSRTPKSALSSAMSALSAAAIGIVQRRETVEPVYQSNGWAPASIVYLPKNPRDMGTTRSPNPSRRLTRKSTRRAPTTASAVVASPGHGYDGETATVVA